MQLSALVKTTQNKPQLLSKEIRGFIALFPFHITAQAFLSAKVSKEIVSPLTTSGRAKGGAVVPKGNMVDGVAAIPQVYHRM
jgi:hypothetical protein